jgi:hypothetical protein
MKKPFQLARMKIGELAVYQGTASAVFISRFQRATIAMKISVIKRQPRSSSALDMARP